MLNFNSKAHNLHPNQFKELPILAFNLGVQYSQSRGFSQGMLGPFNQL
jgi:hypothetical protein